MCMLLRAWDLSVGGCWVCNIPNKHWLQKELNIPRVYEPVALVVLGYPKFIPPKPTKIYNYSPVRKMFRKYAPAFVRKKLERRF